MTRKFNELVERGAVQSSSSTGLLLGLTAASSVEHDDNTTPTATGAVDRAGDTAAPGPQTHQPEPADTTLPTDTDGVVDIERDTQRGSVETDSDDSVPSTVPDPAAGTASATASTAASGNSENADAPEQPPAKPPKDTAARRPRSSGSGAAQELMPSIDAILALLPATDERLITGPRRDVDVRDLTYDITSSLYFSFTRLKTDLSRAAKRKVTNPDLMDVALEMLGEDATTVLAQLETYASEVFDTQSTRRRLTVRVAEERHRHLVDTALDIEEMVGRRVPVTDLWSLAVALLIDRAGRLRSP